MSIRKQGLSRRTLLGGAAALGLDLTGVGDRLHRLLLDILRSREIRKPLPEIDCIMFGCQGTHHSKNGSAYSGKLRMDLQTSQI